MSKHNDDSVLFRLKNMEDLEPSEAFVSRLEATLVQKARQMDKLGRMRKLVPVIGTSFAVLVLGIWLSFFNGIEVVKNGFNPEPVLFEGTKPTIEETISQLTYKIQQPSFLPIDATYGTANINILASHNDQEIQIFYYNQQNGEVFGIGVNRVDHFLPASAELIETDESTKTDYYLYDDSDQNRVLYWKDEGLYYSIHAKRSFETESGLWDSTAFLTPDELIEIAKSFSYEAKPYTRLTSDTFEKVNYLNVREMVKKIEHDVRLGMTKERAEKLFGYSFVKWDIGTYQQRQVFTEEQIEQESLEEFWRLDYEYNSGYKTPYDGADLAEPDKLGLWQRDIGLQLFLWWTEDGNLGWYELWYVLENEKEVYVKGMSLYDETPYDAVRYGLFDGRLDMKYATQRPYEKISQLEEGTILYHLQDDSMQRDGHFPKAVVVDTSNERNESFSRGEIVVFKEGENNRIARIVGLPGEVIGLSNDSRVTIDDRELLTFYGKMAAWTGGNSSSYDVKPVRANVNKINNITVPEGSYFLMSDNWNGTPFQASVSKSQIVGKVIGSWEGK